MHVFPGGRGGEWVPLFHCLPLNLQVSRVTGHHVGRLAKRRPITQHYVAMTKQGLNPATQCTQTYSPPTSPSPPSLLTNNTMSLEIAVLMRYPWLQKLQCRGSVSVSTAHRLASIWRKSTGKKEKVKNQINTNNILCCQPWNVFNHSFVALLKHEAKTLANNGTNIRTYSTLPPISF